MYDKDKSNSGILRRDILHQLKAVKFPNIVFLIHLSVLVVCDCCHHVTASKCCEDMQYGRQQCRVMKQYDRERMIVICERDIMEEVKDRPSSQRQKFNATELPEVGKCPPGRAGACTKTHSPLSALGPLSDNILYSSVPNSVMPNPGSDESTELSVDLYGGRIFITADSFCASLNAC